VSAEKRLADAELAAESYRQMIRAIGESGVVLMDAIDGSGPVVVPGDAVTFGPVRRETSRLGTLKRFARLPHFDEVAA
jgi:hypothetical protein